MQYLIGPVCGGFGDCWLQCSRCPRGAHRRVRGCHRLSAKLAAGSLDQKDLETFVSDLKHKVGPTPEGVALFQAPWLLPQPCFLLLPQTVHLHSGITKLFAVSPTPFLASVPLHLPFCLSGMPLPMYLYFAFVVHSVLYMGRQSIGIHRTVLN